MAVDPKRQVVPPGLRVGFIGSGQMAQAIAQSWVELGLVAGTNITASNPSEPNRKTMEALGANTTNVNSDVIPACDVLLLCVTPQILPGVLREVAPLVSDQHLVISVAAGISIQHLNSMLGDKGRIIRMMPNMLCLVRCGVTAFSAGPRVTADDCSLTSTLFSIAGVCEQLPEGQLDVISALCGSGTSFIFQVIEAMADGAVKMGLPRSLAQQFTALTVKGAATMVEQTGKHPAELKDGACSPGGGTIAGIHTLERGGLRATLMDAVQASTERVVEMGIEELKS